MKYYFLALFVYCLTQLAYAQQDFDLQGFNSEVLNIPGASDLAELIETASTFPTEEALQVFSHYVSILTKYGATNGPGPSQLAEAFGINSLFADLNLGIGEDNGDDGIDDDDNDDSSISDTEALITSEESNFFSTVVASSTDRISVTTFSVSDGEDDEDDDGNSSTSVITTSIITSVTTTTTFQENSQTPESTASTNSGNNGLYFVSTALIGFSAIFTAALLM